MGHTSIASTQIYAQVTDCKISEDMDKLIAKHQEKNKENDTMETEAITIGAMTIVNASRNKSMEETALNTEDGIKTKAEIRLDTGRSYFEWGMVCRLSAGEKAK